MKMIGQVALTINHQGRTRQAHAEKLCHEMIISWRDCIRLEVILKTFPISPEPGYVNEIQNEADAIKETISNKYYIIRDDISHNKILTEPTKLQLKDTKIIPYRASTTRQIPIQYCQSLAYAQAQTHTLAATCPCTQTRAS